MYFIVFFVNVLAKSFPYLFLWYTSVLQFGIGKTLNKITVRSPKGAESTTKLPGASIELRKRQKK